MLPVLGEMALQMNVHPLYLMFPAALSCSMAFHTPVGMCLVILNFKQVIVSRAARLRSMMK